MTRFAAAMLMWGALTLGGCSAERLGSLGSSRDATVDIVETFTSLDSLPVDGCTGSLSDVGTRCPASFDGTADDVPACAYAREDQTVTLCGNVNVLTQGGAFEAMTCYYDAATYVLVAARETSDELGPCGPHFYGQVPGASCDAIRPTLRRICASDGGAG
jgi:hypothetical protein